MKTTIAAQVASAVPGGEYLKEKLATALRRQGASSIRFLEAEWIAPTRGEDGTEVAGYWLATAVGEVLQ